MHKSSIPAVYNAAPPSYAEAMGQPVSTTNVPGSTQCQSTTYPQEHSSSYPSSATAYPYPDNSYSSMTVQSSYNPSYVTANQQNQSVNTPYVINATVVQPVRHTSVRNNLRRRFWVTCVFIIWCIIMVSIFTSIFRFR
ncbi:uncharacterized protein LOC105288129 isoform X2 [Ooceraea biroi]|nr:uncharacterized protein LOC105288129 isoform X2 [Ooceraea biroi]XP_011352452.1 uncharacterized protein LOC105288129 isoform X2 [Ooceraea biroi]EZA60596.1 hypothetical protein X777_14622 [Ooceraea biroi]